jgi:hypothetical protein
VKAIGGLAILFLLGAATRGPDRFGESCTGSESVRVGSQAERHLPFHIELSIDLTKNAYCYAQCGRQQSFRIADASSVPIKLADSGAPGQARRLIFDRATRQLTDDQSFEFGAMGPIVRHASATCRTAPFRTPAEP